MDKIKFLLTVLLLIMSMQTMALYQSVGDQKLTDKVLISNSWVAWFIIPE